MPSRPRPASSSSTGTVSSHAAPDALSRLADHLEADPTARFRADPTMHRRSRWCGAGRSSTPMHPPPSRPSTFPVRPSVSSRPGSSSIRTGSSRRASTTCRCNANDPKRKGTSHHGPTGERSLHVGEAGAASVHAGRVDVAVPASSRAVPGPLRTPSGRSAIRGQRRRRRRPRPRPPMAPRNRGHVAHYRSDRTRERSRRAGGHTGRLQRRQMRRGSWAGRGRGRRRRACRMRRRWSDRSCGVQIEPTAIVTRQAVLDEVGGLPDGSAPLPGLLARITDAGHRIGLVPRIVEHVDAGRTDPIEGRAGRRSSPPFRSTTSAAAAVAPRSPSSWSVVAIT